jgi:hypothetical protein
MPDSSGVACFFQEERDRLRHGDSTPATSSLARLAGFVKRALGHVTPDADEKNLYHLTEGNLVVRSVVGIDGFISHQLTLAEIYQKTLAKDVQGMLTDQKDVVFVVGGHAGCTKSRTLHGPLISSGSLATGGQPPPPSEWGVVRYALEDLIKASSEGAEWVDGVQMNGYEIMVSATRLQLGNIADCLVPKGSVKSTIQDRQALRNQYLRLITIASSSMLEMEESAGNFYIPDAVELPIKHPSDIAHFSNCIAMLRSTTKYYGLAGPRKGSPFHVVVTVKCVPMGGHGHVRYLQFVELAEMDWESNLPTDTATVRTEIEHMCKMLCSLKEMAERRNELENSEASMGRTRSAHRLRDRCESTLRSKSRANLKGTSLELANLKGLQQVELLHLRRATALSRLVFSQLDPFNCKVVFSGHSLFSKVPQIMNVIASLRNEKVRISFQGPNGEGSDEIDDELRQHVNGLQQDSESLRLLYLDSLGENHRLKSEIKSRLAEYRGLNQKLQTVNKMISDESRLHQIEAVNVLQDSRDVAVLRAMMADRDAKARELEEITKDLRRGTGQAAALQGRLKQEVVSLKDRNISLQAEVDQLQSSLLQKETAHRALCTAMRDVAAQVTERLLERAQTAAPDAPQHISFLGPDAPITEPPPENSSDASPMLQHDLTLMSDKVSRLVAVRTAEIRTYDSETKGAVQAMSMNMKSITSMMAALEFLEGLSTSESSQYFAANPKTLLPQDSPNLLVDGAVNQCRAQQWVDYIEQVWIPFVASVQPASRPELQSFEQFVRNHRGHVAPSIQEHPSRANKDAPDSEVSAVRRRLLKDMRFAATQREVTGRSKQRLQMMKMKKF